jgi:hypothetical protein
MAAVFGDFGGDAYYYTARNSRGKKTRIRYEKRTNDSRDASVIHNIFMDLQQIKTTWP